MVFLRKNGGKMVKIIARCALGLLLGLSLTNSLEAIIYQIKIFKRWNPTLNNYQFLMCCKDYHRFYDADYNSKQVNAIKKLINSFDHQSLIIAEDVISYQGDNEYLNTTCPQLSAYIQNPNHNKPITPLAGIVNYVKTLSKNSVNVEYRFQRSAQCQKQSEEFFQTNQLSTKAIAQELTDTLENIYFGSLMRRFSLACGSQVLGISEQQYNDFKNIQNIIPENPDLAHYSADMLDKFIYDDISLRDITEMAPGSEAHAFAFDQKLLNIRALEKIAYATDKNKIMLCMGGKHITDIEPVLHAMNFEKVIEAGPNVPGNPVLPVEAESFEGCCAPDWNQLFASIN